MTELEKTAMRELYILTIGVFKVYVQEFIYTDRILILGAFIIKSMMSILLICT